MDDVIRVLIIDACNCTQKENKERQQNAILEALGNLESSIKIGDATSEALEKKDRVKAVTLENIIDSKMSGIARRCFSEATLQMSKLVKKAIDLEQAPIEKVRIRESNFEKRQRKKAKRQDGRRVKHAQGSQGPSRNVAATFNKHEVIRNDSRQGRGNPGRCHSVGEDTSMVIEVEVEVEI